MRSRKPALFIFVVRTNNNIFFCLSKRNGLPLIHSSAGVLGLSGSRRDSPTSAELSGRSFVRQVLRRGYRRCYLRVTGIFDSALRAAIRGLRASHVRFSRYQYIKPVSHNGVRLQSSRRM